MCIRTEGRPAPKPREYQAQSLRVQRAPEREATVPTRQHPPPVQRRLEHPSA
ncbi:MAG: hypothetical protein AB7P37_20225 [Ramlibacter sp.]|jgi:hypothetical protein|nr:hypothetical protein [Ramlibacter sp.]MCA0212367.1 hypothetical protein [Pseudomonadota bacterium]